MTNREELHKYHKLAYIKHHIFMSWLSKHITTDEAYHILNRAVKHYSNTWEYKDVHYIIRHPIAFIKRRSVLQSAEKELIHWFLTEALSDTACVYIINDLMMQFMRGVSYQD